MMSFVDPDGVAPPTGAGRVGAELRAARERLGWKLADVSASLRIRLSHLEAIEAGKLAELPGAAYAVGFVRTYAATLGLDPDEFARRFRAEAGDINKKTKLSFPAPVPQRGVPAGAVVLLGLLVAAGAYVGWYRYSGNDEAKVTQAAAPPPERLAALAPHTLAPQTQSPQVASILPSAPPASAPQLPAQAIPAPVIPVPVPVAVTISPPAPVAVTPPVATRFVLRAKAGGFVLVQERLGKTLLRRALHPGETWPLPAEPDLLLTTGNAGNVELLVDGKPGPSLGAAGAVLNDLPLDPVLAKAAKANSTGGRPAR
jgi:cytoskeleton protein RodZ